MMDSVVNILAIASAGCMMIVSRQRGNSLAGRSL